MHDVHAYRCTRRSNDRQLNLQTNDPAREMRQVENHGPIELGRSPTDRRVCVFTAAHRPNTQRLTHPDWAPSSIENIGDDQGTVLPIADRLRRFNNGRAAARRCRWPTRPTVSLRPCRDWLRSIPDLSAHPSSTTRTTREQ